jgi:hypothetical protein
MWCSWRGHKWQYNTTHALCMLDSEGYGHILRIFNTYWFSTATVVKRTRLGVMFMLSSSDNLIPDSTGAKMQAGQGGSTARSSKRFLSVSKHYRKTRRTVHLLLAVERTGVSAVFNRNKLWKNTQNVTSTEVILVWETMYSCSQQSRYFWSRYNVVWP